MLQTGPVLVSGKDGPEELFLDWMRAYRKEFARMPPRKLEEAVLDALGLPSLPGNS